ncbi:discoidin domain-containing protein [Verrucomicrobiaceae bacterium 5K15]|uniref:Discoidin domain-containing protein n=1 Tax=Oceaniferula flava TaxID=2800421 RepID=A0AAE2V8Y7_9BACT|nr:discoidin domain-containing protein [Oceaniferula flavus]MBK1856227.1 discoidin domain-containing protein [Oceaniferula flavus]MBM1137534.1 discoidin domain-containing protein [Oceaniferula flavus]
MNQNHRTSISSVVQAMLLSILAVSMVTLVAAKEVNLAKGATVKASSSHAKYPAAKVVDQVVSDASRWVADKGEQAGWIELAFAKPVTIRTVDVYSGWKKDQKSVLADFDISLKIAGKWVTPKSGRIRHNKDDERRIYIEGEKVSQLRLSLVGSHVGRIREIAVYDNKEAEGLLAHARQGGKDAAIDRSRHQIAVNQVGYETGRSKRFTAPLSPDGTEFTLTLRGSTDVLYRGVINNKNGDFSQFRPEDSQQHYLITLSGGSLKTNQSDPFLIRENLYDEQFWQPAVDFLIDSRSVVGTHPSAYGGCPWRDGTYYDAIVPSLVLFYLADTKRIDGMPKQIDWQAEKARVTAANFPFDAKNPGSEGVMEAVRQYYQLEPPKADAPDVVKMIHWGAGYYLVNPATKDPSRDPDGRKIHAQTIEQVAYVVWAWPALKKWLPQSFYHQCYALCVNNWEPSLEINPWWKPSSYVTAKSLTKSPKKKLLHPFKGRHAPGHSIVPNLMMYEVAQREGRKGAEKYLNAAVKQAEWIIKHLDWNDPRTTKGHRMSEHRTIPNLVWLLQKYPDHAPDGLQEKITEWARVAVSRSDNMWDFRRYDLEDLWTIPAMNEVGNSLSVPAIATAAAWVVDDPQLKQRLEELATASVDHVFGRNPQLAAAPHKPDMGFPEIERGWPRGYKDNVCARLELCRGSISSLPGSGAYPFKPGGDFRHPEGWVNYGASWCISLSYFKFDAAATTPSINLNP